MRTLACILLALPLWAAQNLTTTMTGVGTVSFSGISVTASTPVRWDFAFDSFSTAASDSARFIGFGPNSSLPLFGCRMSGTVLQCIDDIDTGAGFPSRDIANWDSANGNYGFSARFERDPSQGTLSLTVCRMDGSNCSTSTVHPSSWGTMTIAGANIGRAGSGAGNNSVFGKLAMFRVSTTLSGTTRPPNAHNAPAGNALDWEFEGSITDSVRSATWSLNWGSPGYTSTIARMPVCNAGTSTTFRAGQAISLDGSNAYALDGNSTLNVIWQQTSGPTALLWSSHAATMPSLTGSVSGTYTFSQVASDASGNKTAPCTVTQGAVATDANGVVLVPNSSHSQFISNLTRMGVNPWPWQDQKQQVFLDWLVDNIDTYYSTYWDTENVGTVQVTSDQIIGTGTSFKSLFCSGGTTPDVDAGSGIGWFQIVVHYPYNSGQGYDGLTGHQELPIWRCTSDTVLEIGRNNGDTAYFWTGNTIIPGPSVSGLKYNVVDGTKHGRNSLGSGLVRLNYYDHVLALYATYYRTGHTLSTVTPLARWRIDSGGSRGWTEPCASTEAGGGLTMPNSSIGINWRNHTCSR
jgi:hypothetical protein